MSLITTTRRTFLAGAASAAALAPIRARADALDDLRRSGAVGERFDGLLELRDPGAAGASALVQKVNAERRKIYAARAAKDKATPEQVGQIYAKQIIEKAPAGTWFLRPDGSWTRK